MYWKKIIRTNPKLQYKSKRSKKDNRIVIDDMYNYNEKSSHKKHKIVKKYKNIGLDIFLNLVYIIISKIKEYAE